MPSSQPLAGKRIVVTRARAQAHELSELLHALGAIPIEWPMIEFAPPADLTPLAEAIRRLPEYDWMIFSSANGVKYFLDRMPSDVRRFPRIAAVGRKTAEALRKSGLRVDAMPDEFLANQIASAIGDVRGQKILVVRPEVAPSALSRSLRERGAQVAEVIAYRTLPVQYPEQLALEDVDAVTLTSASAAAKFARYIQSIPAKVCTASIGPSTSQAARAAGLRVNVEAQIHTLEGLVLALVEHFSSVEVMS